MTTSTTIMNKLSDFYETVYDAMAMVEEGENKEKIIQHLKEMDEELAAIRADAKEVCDFESDE